MHYELKSAFIHYRDTDDETWRDPPHVYFANLRLTSESVLMFERRFGPVCGRRKVRCQTSLDQGRVGHTDKIVREADLAQAKLRQHVLRRAWEGEERQIKQLWAGSLGVRGDEGEYGPVRLTGILDQGAIRLFTESMWGFIRLAFQRDALEGRAQVCSNPGCAA